MMGRYQTRVKHEILSRYLDAWGGIIVGGLKAKRPRDWHFVYVDCFSYLGKYAGEKEDTFQDKETKTVYGSPIIGISALDKLKNHAQNKMGMGIRVNCVLVEQDKSTYQELKQTLFETGYSPRIRETCDFHNLGDGQIAVVNADSIEIIDKLLGFCSTLTTE
jgi:three-Cys-motif partner protein